MKKGRGIFVNLTFGAQDVLATMQATMTLFKSLTNCILVEFDELAFLSSPYN
jgi:hypothetical protein